MKHEKDIHSIQANILKVLLFTPEAKFTDLNVKKISNDHFNFHVKRLLELGLVEKTDTGIYQLTIIGKEFANRFDADAGEMVLERQAKIGVLIGCVQKNDDKKKYLIQQRLKQPYYGFYMFMTGKVKWGETVQETAIRELKEETDLEGKLNLVGVWHKLDYDNEGNLLEDKYFYVFRCENPTGNLMSEFEGGKNIWMTKKEIDAVENLIEGMPEAIKLLNQNKVLFREDKYTVTKY